MRKLKEKLACHAHHLHRAEHAFTAAMLTGLVSQIHIIEVIAGGALVVVMVGYLVAEDF